MKTKPCARLKTKMCVNPINPQPLENFYAHKGMKDGFLNVCSACIKEMNHQKRLEQGGGRLGIPKRPPASILKEKNCSKFKSGKCASSVNPQPIEDFRVQVGRTNGRSHCISCEKEYEKSVLNRKKAVAKKWNFENREKRRNTLYNKLYGISLEVYNKMFEEQKGCCAICKEHQTSSKQIFNVDHCHISGKVRGLLCTKCNRGLGLFNDNIDKLKQAIAYIEKHKGD